MAKSVGVVYLFEIPFKKGTMHGLLLARNKESARKLLRIICKIRALPKGTFIGRNK